MIKVKINHKSRQILMNIQKSMDGHKKGLRNGLYEIGRENVKLTRKFITAKNKTGRIYIIGGRRHQASAPGESPANLTGQLRRSVNYVVRGSSQMEFGDEILYGKFLEQGTSKMLPRPHLIRTVNARGQKNVTVLQRNIDREIKRRAK